MSDELINLDRNKYNSIVMTKECYKSDPKYYVIASITTRVNHLEGGNYRGGGENPTKNSSTTWSYGKGGSGDATVFPGPVKWIIVKGKNNITWDGKVYFWCPHHKRDNLYDGMYM